MASTLPRRCLSSSDLATFRSYAGQVHDQQLITSDSDCEDCIEHFKPIKRSRSDQSLPALDQYTPGVGAPATTTAGARHSYRLAAQYGSKKNTSTVLQASTAPAASNSSSISGLGTLSFTRSQRLPSLPVVLSDIGSSTNSLLSLDSDVTSQFAGGSSSPAAAQAASSMLPAATASGAAGLTAADTALLQASSNKRSSSTAALCSMYNVSSAASLTQLTAAQQDLYRTTSETSIGSGSYLIQLQQLVPPLPPYSPPPLFSPGPVSVSNLSTLLYDQGAIATDPVPASPSGTGATSQPGLSGLLKGVSIQQQKRAGFAAIGAPVAQSKQQQQQGVRGSSVGQLNSSSSRTQAPVGRRALPAVSSIDSITSVEAGEHSLGFAFAHHRSLASPGVPGPHRFPRDLPSPTAAHSSASPGSFSGRQHLALAGGVAARQLPVQAQGAAIDSSDSSAALIRPSSSAVVDPFEPLLADLTAAGFVLSPSSAASRATSLNRSLADSPAVQLQAMGSMLGNEGEQWLLPEVSTGAIGLHHVQGLAMPNVSAQPAAIGDSLPNGLPAVQQPTEASAQPTISQAMAAPAAPPVVAVSSALPAGAGGSNLPSTAARAGGRGSLGSFGFGFGAAAAAAAAKLSMFQEVAAAGPEQSSSTNSNPDDTHDGLSAAGRQQPPGIDGAAPIATAAGGLGSRRLHRDTASDSGAAAAAAAMWSAPLPREVTAGQMEAVRSAMTQQQQGPAAPWQHSQLHQHQFASAPFRAAAVSDGSWDFSRRPASFDCARGSRRRGSLELNMPWRSRLDAVIARVAAEATDQPSTAHSGITGQPGTPPAPKGTDDLAMLAGLERATAAATAAADPFYSSNGSSGTSGGWHPQLVLQQRRSKLDLLQPLLETEPGAGSSNTSSQRQSAEESVGIHDSLRSARSSSSSGASVAADHDMPGSTNLGGYIGGSDGLGLAAARSYGLEFDGAVVMETIGGDTDDSDLQEVPGEGSAGESQHGQQDFSLTDSVDSADSRSWGADAIPEHDAQALHQQQHTSHLTQQQQHEEKQRQHHLQQHLERQQQKHKHLQQQLVVVLQDQNLQEADGQQQQQQQLSVKAASADVSDGQLATGSLIPANTSAFSPVAPSSAAGAGRQLSVSIGPGPASEAGSGAAYELFVRLKCARQTLEYAKRQAEAFAELDKAELGVWEALELLNGMREYEAALLTGTVQGAVGPGGSGGADEPLTPDMPLKEHALQVAELCRLSFPDKPWMALVGLLHGLGKLLAHPRWKSQPQWAVAGESFPVGCRFAPQISHSEFLSANPDRRRRTYSTALGVYQEHCGLRNVYMSWGAPEYLYMLLVLNQTELPEEALFMIRYQRCAAITRPGGAYRQLMSDADRALLPLLAAFQNLTTYRRVQLPPEALQGEQLIEYYDRLIETYLGEERLFW